MNDLITLAQTWGPLGAAVVALAVALRTYAASSSRTIDQLRTWLTEAQREVVNLRNRIEVLEMDRQRLADEVERLTPYQARAESLARELRERQRAAKGGTNDRRTTYREPGGPAEVVQLPTAAARGSEET